MYYCYNKSDEKNHDQPDDLGVVDVLGAVAQSAEDSSSKQELAALKTQYNYLFTPAGLRNLTEGFATNNTQLTQYYRSLTIDEREALEILFSAHDWKDLCSVDHAIIICKMLVNICHTKYQKNDELEWAFDSTAENITPRQRRLTELVKLIEFHEHK